LTIEKLSSLPAFAIGIADRQSISSIVNSFVNRRSSITNSFVNRQSSFVNSV
jgi:hypothetical protein